MKKRFLGILLALCMMLSLLPTGASAAEIVQRGKCGEDVEYTLDSNGSLTIFGSGPMSDDSRSPFFSNGSILSVTIAYGVSGIRENAFHSCENLTRVSIASSVTSIGDGAFACCDSLPAIEIPNSVKSIGDSAFFCCTALTAVEIPSSVKSIGINAFLGCTGLTDITLREGLESIGAGAFNECSGLTDIELPASLKSIGGNAFSDCTGLTSMEIPAGVTSIEDSLFSSCTGLKSVTLPSGVTSIGDNAFAECNALTSLEIPKNVTRIGAGAFSGCNGLTSLELPKNVRSIGEQAFSYCIGLTSMEIPEGVTSIEGGVFSECINLKSVTLPSGLTSIGTGAFYSCRSLERLDIPKGVTSIGEMAFAYCRNLTGIVIPKGVKSIERRTFEECRELTEIAIPKGVPSIGSSAFENCSDLKTVWIPSSVTKIGNKAFYECYELTDVYFSGTEEQWNQIVEQNGDGSMPGSVRIHFEASDPVLPGEMTVLDPVKSSGIFHAYSDHLQKAGLTQAERVQFPFNYDETWFETIASEFQFDLAGMSLRMSMAGMARGGGDPTDHANIQELFTKLQFSNQKFEYPKTETNSIGYAIGSKNVRGSNGRIYSLVAVVVRSGGYFEEWGGNVTLGPGGNHSGFQQAADKTLAGIEAYIKDLKSKGQLTDNIKIWITGYSRGAATTNLAAAQLNSTYGKENVFAYCFACPQGTLDSNSESAQYNNIFCIVNPIDLVPKVAMGAWGFRRYGKTYYLPASTNAAHYSSLKARKDAEYKKLIAENGGTNDGINEWINSFLATNANPAQSPLFDQLVTNLASNLDRVAYYKYHEQNFTQAVSNLMGVEGASLQDNAPALMHLLAVEFYNSNFNPAKDKLFGIELGTLALCAKYAHFPELYLAWMNALDGETIRNFRSGYRTVIINCPVDVSVYDAEDHLVAQIVHDEPQELESGIGAYLDENGQKVVVLPMDMEYRLDVKATDNGSVTYTAADYDMDSGAYTQVVSYEDIPIEKGDLLVGTASLTDHETAEYTLKENDGETLRPDVQETGDAVRLLNVAVTAEAGGTVEGGGAFVIGEYARILAEPESGCRFLGWYDGNTRVSSEPEYRFAVQKDVALTARFEKEAQQNPFRDVPSDAYYYDAVLWAVSHVPQITQGTGLDTFSPDMTCTRGQVVTFLWRAAGCPEPDTTGNPFTDVSPDAYYYDAVLWAVENGITQGTGNGLFSPDGECTRGQVVTFLHRANDTPAVENPENPFHDVAQDAYYYNAVLWAVENKITSGTGAGAFSPGMTCSRGQIVTFLYRAMR